MDTICVKNDTSLEYFVAFQRTSRLTQEDSAYRIPVGGSESRSRESGSSQILGILKRVSSEMQWVKTVRVIGKKDHNLSELLSDAYSGSKETWHVAVFIWNDENKQIMVNNQS